LQLIYQKLYNRVNIFSKHSYFWHNKKTTLAMSSTTEQANAPRHYILLTVAIVIGIVGVYLRFAGDARIFNIAANIILVIAVLIALKAVFAIMK
jgi:hypothetical protein